MRDKRILKQQNHEKLYSRHLTSNNGAQKLLAKLGFEPLGKAYDDEDGLHWQNVAMDL